MEPRVRTFDLVEPSIDLVVKRDYWSGTESDPTRQTESGKTTLTRTSTPKSESQVMTDYVVPDFHKRRAKGEIFNNPMERTVTETIDGVTNFAYQHMHRIWQAGWSPPGYQTRGYYYYGSLPISHFLEAGEVSLLPAPTSLDREWLASLAVTKAWSNCELSKAAALATIAESKESVTSIFSILRRVLKIARYVKKLQIGKLAQELKPKELADRWMEVRYALRPLVYDAKAITEALNARLKHDRQTFRGFKKDSDVQTNEFVHGALFPRAWKIQTVQTIEVRSGVLTQIESLNALNTWGFDQFLETAWELVPLSFVFDWFWNLGETLAAWTPEVGLKPLASWYVAKTVTSQTASLVGWYPGVCDSSTCSWGGVCDVFTCTASSASYVKTTTSTERVPDPTRAVLPSFRINLNAAKCLDLSIIGKKKLF